MGLVTCAFDLNQIWLVDAMSCDVHNHNDTMTQCAFQKLVAIVALVNQVQAASSFKIVRIQYR